MCLLLLLLSWLLDLPPGRRLAPQPLVVPEHSSQLGSAAAAVGSVADAAPLVAGAAVAAHCAGIVPVAQHCPDSWLHPGRLVPLAES